MKIFIKILFLNLIYFSGQSQSFSISAAEDLLEAKSYKDACDMYFSLLSVAESEKKDLNRAGEACLRCGQLKYAESFLTRALREDDKYESESLFFMARTKHLLGKYEEAADYYKSFLKFARKSDDSRLVAKQNLLYLSKAITMSRSDEKGRVRNLGSDVNTVYDEMHPIKSPTFDEVLYYSQNGRNSIGGLRDEKGLEDAKSGFYRKDIFRSTKEGSSWSRGTNMGEIINSSMNDYIHCFSDGGRSMYVYKGVGDEGGTLSKNIYDSESETIDNELIENVFSDHDEVGSVYFWRDSMVLFSSRHKSSIGGFDLFVSINSTRGWTSPKNLGEGVNSEFDEVDPFLSRDGRSLFFSTDRVAGFGGFDIVQSKYSEKREAFLKPVNLGPGINSPAEERMFKLDNNGKTALMVSDRYEGYGGFDIYQVEFFKVMQEQLTVRDPKPIFDFAKDNSTPVYSNTNTSLEEEVVLKSEFDFGHFFYKNEKFLRSKTNKTNVKKVIEPLILYPSLSVILAAHTSNDASQHENLFNGLTYGKILKRELEERGISENRIVVRSFGSLLPLVVNSDFEPTALEKGYNNRIEVHYYDNLNRDIRFNREEVVIPPHLKANKALLPQKGLNYRVMIAKSAYSINDQIFIDNPDVLAEYDDENQLCMYFIGGFKNYVSAKIQLNQLQRSGFGDAVVVPYLDEYPIERSAILDLSKSHSDLVNYLSDN